MKFELPNAVAAMNNAVAAVGEDGDSWELVGDPLTELVDEIVPAYDEKLDLKLDPSPGAKRAEISTVRWGKIDKDIARLTGVAAAIRNVVSVIRSGKDTIAHEWKGESFEAFRTQIEKVEKTLDDYATAVAATAAGLKAALEGTRRLFTAYRDNTVEVDLALVGRFSPPGDWWRLSSNDAEHFVDNCGSQTAISDCLYNNDEQLAIIDRRLTNRRLYDQVTRWDCTRDPGVVIGQYRWLVDSAFEERNKIHGKVYDWYEATDDLKTRVRDVLDAALENLRVIAEVKVFSTLAVPGATVPTGDPGPGAPGPGDPGPVGGEAAMPPPPAPEPPPAPAPEPVKAETAPDPAEDPTTVSIKDGDRTISVRGPDGQGLIKLTVTDASGTPKSYALDFDAASGLGRRPGTESPAPEEGVEQVPARTNGKCVIQDGEVTLTAERPLFSPDSLTVTVEDGTGPPRSYTLDFPEEPEPEAEQAPAAEANRQAASAQEPSGRPAAGAAQNPAAATALDSAPRPAAQEPASQDPGARPAATQDGTARSTAGQGSAASAEEAQGPTGQDSAAEAAALDSAAPPAGQDSAATLAAAEPNGQAVAAQDPAVRSASTAPEPAQPAAQAPNQTSPQAWTNQSGSLSGVLESNNVDGEAGLASAPDDPPQDATGMAGAGLPVMGNANGGEPGRSGSGWSVHGDLFDSGEPVYSMHGVLGDDDLDARETP